MANVNPWSHNTYDMLYEMFCRDIRDHDLRYCGHRVWTFPELDDGKEVIFWHLTSREAKPVQVPRRQQKFVTAGAPAQQKQRLPDLRRCERLPWVKPIIEHAQDVAVVAWDYMEGDGVIKTYVWLKAHDFVIIMKKYPDGRRRLVTSFYVDQPYTRADFERKYANRLQN